MRFLLLLLAASMIPVTGCIGFGCDAGTSNYDSSPVTLTAPRTTAARVSDCSQSAKEFAGGFTLSVDSDGGSFVVSVAGSAQVGQATPLTVGLASDAAATQVANAADRTIRLAYNPGQAPADDSGLASALVTVVSEPTGDSSETLSVVLDLRFLDGRELAETFTAPIEKASPCPVE